MEYRHIEAREEEGALVITLLTDKFLDDAVCDETAEEIERAQKEPHGLLVVDCWKTTFFSSTIIGKLITADKREVAQGNKNVALCHVDPRIGEVLAITKLNKLFRVVETLEIALRD
jgi:anti-anti-sigma factor